MNSIICSLIALREQYLLVEVLFVSKDVRNNQYGIRSNSISIKRFVFSIYFEPISIDHKISYKASANLRKNKKIQTYSDEISRHL